MKNYIPSVLVLLSLFLLFSCEEEVVLNLESAQPRLVVNAPLTWAKGTAGKDQYITLSLTKAYYENEVPYVTNATVEVTDEIGTVFSFKQESTAGKYECHNFLPVVNRKYFLKINYKGEEFVAEEKLYPVVNFDKTIQTNEGGANKDEIEVKAYFSDPKEIANYYLTKKEVPFRVIPEYTSFNDQFFDGNQIFDFFTDKDLKTNDKVIFTLYGISLEHQNYMNKIINATGGNPFQPIPGVVKGNVSNSSNKKNYPLGYFSLSQTASITHSVE